jgi:hypothetical protein
MRNPLLSLSARARVWLVAGAFTVTVAGIVVLGLLDPGRMTGNGPGIVGFELAGSRSNAVGILNLWTESGVRVAAFNLGFDYLFILGYTSFMSLLCLWTSGRQSNLTLSALGVILAALQCVAGLLDCTENTALLRILFVGATDTAASIAQMCAIGKFSLLSCGAAYVLLSLTGVGRIREVK